MVEKVVFPTVDEAKPHIPEKSKRHTVYEVVTPGNGNCYVVAATDNEALALYATSLGCSVTRLRKGGKPAGPKNFKSEVAAVLEDLPEPKTKEGKMLREQLESLLAKKYGKHAAQAAENAPPASSDEKVESEAGNSEKATSGPPAASEAPPAPPAPPAAPAPPAPPAPPTPPVG